MTEYVCTDLSQPDLNGLQNCKDWEVHSFPIPAITREQSHQLTQDIVIIFIIAYGWVIFKRFLDKA